MPTLFDHELNRACPKNFPGEARESNQPYEDEGLMARKQVASRGLASSSPWRVR